MQQVESGLVSDVSCPRDQHVATEFKLSELQFDEGLEPITPIREMPNSRVRNDGDNLAVRCSQDQASASGSLRTVEMVFCTSITRWTGFRERTVAVARERWSSSVVQSPSVTDQPFTLP